MLSTMDFISSTLNIAIDKHGSGIVLSVIEGLVKSHATHLEVAPHGLFIKMHFEKTKKAESSIKAKTDDTNDTSTEATQSPPPGLERSANIIEETIDPMVDPVGRCKQIAEVVSSKLQAIQLQTNQEEYDNEVLDSFHDVLVACPRKPSTRLSRKELEKKHGEMYRTALWSKVVKKYHDETGDPTSKTDLFLEVMATIAKLKDNRPRACADG